MELFPPQQAVADHGILDLGFSSVLSLATGSGKTTLAEMAMDRRLNAGDKVVYLTPLKAIAEEKVAGWADRWPGRQVGIYTGDHAAPPIGYADADVLIATFERMDGILRFWQKHLHWLSRVSLVVVDELHLLLDPVRGPRLEGMLSRLQRVNPFCTIMGLSGTISSHSELAAWLGGVSFHSDWRPVPLTHEVRRFKKATQKDALVADLVAETHDDGGQALVFVSSRKRAERLAAALATGGLAAGFHHAGLAPDRRHAVEAAFRSGKLAALVATPTLEQGVNLPCSTVILADSSRYDGSGWVPIPVWSYLQRAGRAGRPGQDRAGRAILLAPAWDKTLPKYATATPEPIQSHLGNSVALTEQILIEVSSRACRSQEELAESFLPSTLAWRQIPDLSARLDKLITQLLDAGMLTLDDRGGLHGTPLGRAVVRHQISPETAQWLLSLVKHPPIEDGPTDFDLLLYHCWDRGLQPTLPVSIETCGVLEDLVADIPSRLLDAPPPAAMQPKACANGVLMAVAAWFMTQGDDPAELAERFELYAFDLVLLRESLVRLLRASADIHRCAAGVPDLDDDDDLGLLFAPGLDGRLRRLALRLEHGLTREALPLAALPGCGGVFARRLLDAGISDLEDLCQMESDELQAIPGVGPKRAALWVGSASTLMTDDRLVLADPIPAPPCRQNSIPGDWPDHVEPGRLSRALQLDVKRHSNGAYLVSGGADSHITQADHCDCADHQARDGGWWCKHRLAIHLAQDDGALKALAGQLIDLAPAGSLAGNLAGLALGRRIAGH